MSKEFIHVGKPFAFKFKQLKKIHYSLYCKTHYSAPNTEQSASKISRSAESVWEVFGGVLYRLGIVNRIFQNHILYNTYNEGRQICEGVLGEYYTDREMERWPNPICLPLIDFAPMPPPGSGMLCNTLENNSGLNFN